MRIFLIYLFLAIILFIPQLTGARTFFGPQDASVQSYAWLSKIENALLNFDLPLWDFSTESGTSFMGEMQTGAFYPPAWILSVFPPYKSIAKLEFFILLHFAWAAFGAYSLFREFKLSKTAAFFGGLLFGFVGPAATRSLGQPNLHAGVVQIPWMILFAKRGASSIQTLTTIKNYCFCAAFGALAILAGHMHGFIHGILAAALVVPFVTNQPIKKILYFSIVFPLTITLAGIQFFPSYEYFHLAYKWYGSGYTEYPHVVPFQEFGRYVLTSACSLWPYAQNCPKSESTNLFFTFTGYFFALLGVLLIFKQKQYRPAAYFILLTCVALIFATSGTNFIGSIIYSTPILNIVRIPSRALHLYSLAVAGLTAAGIQLLINKTETRSVKVWSLAIIMLLGLLSWEVKTYSLRQFNLPANTPRAAPVYYQMNPVFEFLIDRNQQERGLYRYFTIPNSILPANLGNVYPVKGLSSYKSSKLKSYFDYLSADWDFKSDRYQRIGLKYIVSEQAIENLDLVLEYKNIKVYQQATDPIFYFTKNRERVAIPSDTKVEWTENSVSLTLPSNFSTKGFDRFVFAQPAYPGWHATVDNKKYEILANRFLTVIAATPKMQKITFNYWPKSLTLGIASTAASLLLILAVLILERKFRHYENI